MMACDDQFERAQSSVTCYGLPSFIIQGDLTDVPLRIADNGEPNSLPNVRELNL